MGLSERGLVEPNRCFAPLTFAAKELGGHSGASERRRPRPSPLVRFASPEALPAT